MSFEINLIFLIKPFFLHDHKVMIMQRIFKMKSKAFFINFKGILLKQITKIFLEGESPTLSWIKIATLSSQGLQQ